MPREGKTLPYWIQILYSRNTECTLEGRWSLELEQNQNKSGKVRLF